MCWSFSGIESLECVLLDMFMGGSETTSTSLMWAVAILIHHPDIQVGWPLTLFVALGRAGQVVMVVGL